VSRGQDKLTDWLEALGDTPVRIRFWVCPVREHGDRTDARGWPVVTVEWRDGVAYCTAPDCDRTSAKKAGR
jgi:formylglycine-generating enzyme required for sulfatase activity